MDRVIADKPTVPGALGWLGQAGWLEPD